MNILKIKLLTLITIVSIIIGLQNVATAQNSHFPWIDGKAYVTGEDIILRTFPGNTPRMVIKQDGKIGIGTSNPGTLLSIDVPNQEKGLTIKNGNYGNSHFPWSDGKTYINGKQFIVRTNGTTASKLIIDEDGRVLIGASAIAHEQSNTSLDKIDVDQYRLFVQSGIVTEKVKCAIKSTNDWSDYVFEEDYERMPLDELEDFVTENKHLPKVPSAEEMVENGLDVAKMDAKLLEKIEEAYLYIIDMNKEMEAMNEKVDALANENQSLKISLQSISTSGK